jgi:hypothetical protein
VLREIDEVTGEDARPDHVDLEDVDVRRVGGQDLLIERQTLGRRIGRRDHVDLIAGRLGPGVGALLAQLQLEADRAAGNRKGGSRGAGCMHPQSGPEQRRTIEPTAHRTPPLIGCSWLGSSDPLPYPGEQIATSDPNPQF